MSDVEEKTPEADEEPTGDDGEEPTDDGAEEEAEQLGDPGKRALDRMKERIKEERQRRKDLEAKLAEANKPKPNGEQPDVEEVRRQAREEAAAEALRDRVLDKIEAKARKFVDSEDAAAILLRSHTVDDFIDSGKVDMQAITEALDELADAKPHLLTRQAPAATFDTGRGKKTAPGQLTRDEVKKMSPQDIVKAKAEGRLKDLLGHT